MSATPTLNSGVPTAFSFSLPAWVPGFLAAYPLPPSGRLASDSDKMRFVLALCRKHVEEKTGGPFSAALFDRTTHALVAVGLNLVVPASAATLHAEVVAFNLGGAAVGSFDLAHGGRSVELVSSTEPCAMCGGATAWSGVSRLVCGARDADARAAGFDEGHKPEDWRAGLEKRGVEVAVDVCRDEAAEVLRAYVAGDGVVYNAGKIADMDLGAGAQ